MPSLSVVVPGGSATQHELYTSPFVVGRDPNCDLVLDYPFVSRRQLVFEQREEGWFVRGEGRNEVRVEGAPLEEEQKIEPGATLQLGPITVVYDEAQEGGIALSEGHHHEVTLEISLAEILSQDEGSSRHLALLSETSGKLAAAKTRREVAQIAAQALRQAVDARTTCVAVIPGGNPDPTQLHQLELLGASGHAIDRISFDLVERALRSNSALTIDDVSAVPPLAERPSIAQTEPGPVMLAALGAPSAGVLYSDREMQEMPFRVEDATFTTVLAHLVGAALDAAARTEDLMQDRDRLVLERQELLRDIERLGRFGSLIGSSPPMQQLAAAITKVAPTDATVLITGETGSGKELVAREIHGRSMRETSFLALNCAALPDTLVESELFGHKRGAFSGAEEDRKGIFEVARGGTVFLDEIGELALTAQAKVLRALDAKEIMPLGSNRPVKIEVRLVAATNRDLEQEAAAGRFRQDLLFRLRVFPIPVPPLRDRKEDIRQLVEHFVRVSSEARRKGLQPPTEAFYNALKSYSFPGNVRELSHIIEQAAILADEGEVLDIDHLQHECAAQVVDPLVGVVPPSLPTTAQKDVPLRSTVAEYERAVILQQLEKDGWNRTKAAKNLKVSLRAFMDKLKRYEIKGPKPR